MTLRGFGRSFLALGTLAAALAASALIAGHAPPRTLSAFVSVRNSAVQEAAWWRQACNGVQCTLCPFGCFLPEGVRGRCRVRMNSGGMLKTLVYGHPISVHIDPIEKKPIFHLLPGSFVYSLATAGCNLSCRGCQNWEISQAFPEQAAASIPVPVGVELSASPDGRVLGTVRQAELAQMSPAEVVAAALATHCRSIAYTYSEPIVFYEYVRDTARLAKQKGLRNVMVTGGCINPEPLAELLPDFDVVKVDLKGFDRGFYRNYVGGELDFVLAALRELKRHGTFVELVNLVVPTLNDSPESLRALSVWVRDHMGPDTPLFFTRFSPNYRVQNLPQTPVETLEAARDIALREGLRYVYVGNVPGHPGETTYCPKCHRPLIRRYGYAILSNLLTPEGRCPFDGAKIPGIWH